ncbi:MAG: hypothetical protein H7A12_14860 [Pseudomonadales bacterium]|nr:hypothetical protein [Pseudomonadales bacterium]
MSDFQRLEFQAIMKARKLIRDIGVSSVPIDLEPFAIAANARIKTVHDLNDDESGQATQLKGKHVIIVNGNHREERQRFTASMKSRISFSNCPHDIMDQSCGQTPCCVTVAVLRRKCCATCSQRSVYCRTSFSAKISAT